MKKIRFVISGITFFIGLITVLLTMFVKNVLPVLGFMAFQIAASGSYDPRNYSVSFVNVNIISNILIGAGLIGMVMNSLHNDKSQ